MTAPTTASLADFLLAQLAADEAVAQDCLEMYPPDEPFGLQYQHDHQMRHDPARVLADIKAKRAIVALHGDEAPDCTGGFAEGVTHGRASEVEGAGYCPTLRALAQPYRGAHGWDESWSAE